jgi:hypothetical protein
MLAAIEGNIVIFEWLVCVLGLDGSDDPCSSVSSMGETRVGFASVAVSIKGKLEGTGTFWPGVERLVERRTWAETTYRPVAVSLSIPWAE